MARVVALITAAVVVVGAVHSWPPLLTDRRGVITSSPGVEPLFSRDDVTLPAGQRLCVAPVVVTTQTTHARLTAVAYRGPARDLQVQVQAPGYESTGRVPAVRPGALQPVAAQFPSPGRTLTAR